MVEVALDAIERGGYTGLSMRGVARTLDVSLASVQHHFPTKHELWTAAIDSMVTQAERRRADAGLSTLADRIDAVLEQGSARPGLLMQVLTDRAPGHEERIALVAERFAGVIRAQLTDLRTLRNDGAIRDVPFRAVLALMTMGIGAISAGSTAVERVYGFDLHDAADRRRLAEALADILSSGVVQP